MINVPFLPIYIVLISVWILYSFLKWHNKKPMNWKREICVQILFIYLLLVLKLTFTPFRLNLLYTHRDMSLIPFIETVKMVQGARLIDSIYNIFGNLAMMAPLGFLIAFIYPKTRNWTRIFSYALGLSLVIEVMQYVSATRIFDIDDVILNTLGGLIGYLFFQISKKAFPPISPKETDIDKPSGKAIGIGFAIFILSFFMVFGYAYQSQTMKATENSALHISQNTKELLTVNKDPYRFILLQNNSAIKVEVYKVLPFDRLILLASSDELGFNTDQAVLGVLDYQIAYEMLNKTGNTYVNEKAPYALFGSIPKTIQQIEVFYNNEPQATLIYEQYFLSVFNADIPFEKRNQLITVNIRDSEGKFWIPTFPK